MRWPATPIAEKTTLFNELTGSNQYVGNWPGVTVEKKEGRLKPMEKMLPWWISRASIPSLFGGGNGHAEFRHQR